MADGLIEYNPGDVIFAEGDEGNSAFVVEEGKVEIFAQDGPSKTVLAVIEEGELFGEMALIDSRPRTATATALEPTRLTEVSDQTILSRLGEADPVIRLLLNVVMQRYRSELGRRKGETEARKDVGPDKSSGLGGLNSALTTIKMEGDLRLALQRGEFVLNYQPLVNMQTGFIAGHEALIRWIHPEKGFIPPDQFIPVSERTNLIGPIGLWVLEEACRTHLKMQAIMDERHPEADAMFMSINVSGRQFQDPNFLSDIQRIVNDVGIDPTVVKLEITETVLADHETALSWINACREMGFHIALDDFGTGYSSLSYLHMFPFDTLKIDRAFVSKMLSSRQNMSIVLAVMEIARGSEMAVVAEGIEEAEEYATLKDLSCHYGQGYFMSRPLKEEDALETLVGQHFLHL